ncbi:MAG: tetratricopeptide repeat protein [Planctomycetaceae bacterium]|nr:tetratricopeptide repeat protein [Planctomycetaceae bacterium]
MIQRLNSRLLFLLASLTLVCVCQSNLFAQNAPQFIARKDIKSGERLLAQAGDLIDAAESGNGQLTLTDPEGKAIPIDRNQVAGLEEAIGVLDRLIEKEPKETRLHSARANVWAARGDFEKAIEDATKAIDVSDGKQARLFVNRGVFHSSVGKIDLAIADYVKATHIDPSMHSAYRNLTSAYIAQKEYDKAIEVCNGVLEVDGRNPDHYIQRGVAYRHMEDWDKAVADFTQALELDQDNLAALGSRGFVFYLKGDHASAVKDFDRIVQLQPNDPMAYNNRGYNRYLAGDFRNALSDYNKAVELLPTYATAWQNKAWLLATCPDDAVRNGAQAIAAAQKACDLRKSKVASDLKALAAAYAEHNDFEMAAKHQQEVVGLVEADQKEAETAVLKDYRNKKPFRTSKGSP